MQRVHLGASGIEVSKLCMGTMTFGEQTSERDAHRMLDICLERGVDFIDTANMYAAGDSERVVGTWLAAQPGRRDRVVLASKVRYPVGDDASTAGLSRRTILRELDRTLERMRTDHLDVYYLHGPDYHTDLDETLHAVDSIVRDGRVRAVGVSNYAAWQMADIWWRCRSRGWAAPTVVQPMYNLISRDIEVEILPFARRFDLGVVAYSPLAAGLLTGKHQHAEAPPKGGRFDVLKRYVDRYWHRPHFEAVQALAEAAERAGRSLTAFSLQWLLGCPSVHAVILGASSVPQLEANLAAAEEGGGAPLDEASIRACDDVYRRLRGFPPPIVR